MAAFYIAAEQESVQQWPLGSHGSSTARLNLTQAITTVTLIPDGGSPPETPGL